MLPYTIVDDMIIVGIHEFGVKYTAAITPDPPLNAMKPMMRMKPPSEIKGIECPLIDWWGLSGGNLSILGPRILAPTNAQTPPDM